MFNTRGSNELAYAMLQQLPISKCRSTTGIERNYEGRVIPADTDSKTGFGLQTIHRSTFPT